MSRKLIGEILSNLIVFGFAMIGVLATILSSSFMSGTSVILYYTIQSNIWIGLTCLIFAIALIVQANKNTIVIPKWLYLIKFIFVVAITLTMIVFWTLLAPTLMIPSYLFSLSNLFSHTLTPLAALITFIGFDSRKQRLSIKESLLSLVTPVYYLIFVFIMCALGITFHTFQTPYFFLNFYEFGWFGSAVYSNTYGFATFGVFYWILIILAFIFLLGYGLTFVNQCVYRISHKNKA